MYELERQFREELTEHLDGIGRYALRLTRDRARADDLVSRTVVRALENEATFMPGTEMGFWLVSVMRSCYYSEWRKTKHEVEDPDGVHALRVHSNDDILESLLAKESLSFMALLDPEQERVLMLAAEGYTVEEIAELMGVAGGTAKSRLSRARDALYTLIQEEESRHGS